MVEATIFLVIERKDVFRGHAGPQIRPSFCF